MIEIQHLVTKLLDGCVCMVCWPAAILKLSWFPISDYIKNIEYIGDRKFTEAENCHKDEVLTKLLQK